jgi:hypothetical protein
MNSDDYNGWIGRPWSVSPTDSAAPTFGIAANAALRFTSAMTIEIQNADQSSFVVWGKRCEVSNAGLFGVTDDADEKPFVVKLLDSGELSCELVDTSAGRQQLILSSLSAFLEALSGATLGSVGSRLRQAAEALGGAAAPNLRTAEVNGTPLTTSNAIWIAGDPGNRGHGSHPVPHPGPNPRVGLAA